MGKRVKVKFMINNLKREEWFAGVILIQWFERQIIMGYISHVIKNGEYDT